MCVNFDLTRRLRSNLSSKKLWFSGRQGSSKELEKLWVPLSLSITSNRVSLVDEINVAGYPYLLFQESKSLTP